MEDNIYPFLCDVVKLLTKEPLFVLINSYTTGLQPAVLTYLLRSALKGQGFEGDVQSDEVGLPVTKSGLVLPCGAAGRFTGKG